MTHPHVNHSERQTMGAADRPAFLSLPPRSAKPRQHGVSHILDNGLSLSQVSARLSVAADTIDLWKLGWGTAYIDPSVRAKVDLLHQHGVMACTGGTLLEISWQQGVTEKFLDWAETIGFPAIEVSSGSVAMSRDVKDGLIEQAASRFVVLAEVGRKDPAATFSAQRWGKEAEADIAAGAQWVVTEGRASGTVGLFTADGEVRTEVADAVVSGIGLERALFEAPRRAQQAWLISHYGPNVNLGNISDADALSLETLRLGLRSDTMDAPFTLAPLASAQPAAHDAAQENRP